MKIFNNNSVWDWSNAELLQYYDSNMICVPLIPQTLIKNNECIQYFDDKLCVDDSTYHDIDNNYKTKIHGYMDIITHPTYNIPCPFIRLWYSSGCLLNLSDVKGFLFNGNHEIDNYQQEEHPFHGTPCFTFHICGIEENLKVCDTSNIKLLKFVSWLTIIGRYIGITISPS